MRRLAAALGKFVSCSPTWPRTVASGCAEARAQELLSILRKDLEPELFVDRRGRRPHITTLAQWRRKCYNQNVKIKALRKQLSMFRSSRRLGKHWLVNAGLSETRTSLRSVEAWCREFAIDEISPLSYATVSQARDTFAQLLVAFNREDMTRYTDGITHGFVLVRHLHDEASMRMRSQLPAAPAAEHGSAAAPAAEHRHVPLRGRSSKIQNNVVTMHRNSRDKQLPVLLELQPLARKDAGTLATALRGVIDTVATAMAKSTHGRVVRLIHCLVGDGIFTNAAAARLLWSWAAAAPVAPHYRLLVITCSTHAANLVARTAICDDERNADNSPLVATCVRFFKDLMPEYAAEFVARLRAVVEARLQLHPGTPPPAVVAQWIELQELYGKRVIPDSLCSLVNGAPGALEHWSGAAGRSRESLVADVALEVERRCLRSEERPVTTRFWLFEGCVQTLFRWKLLDLPAADVLQTGVQKPRASNQKRITRVRRYLEDNNTRFQLAVACLCLRLTSLATSITGQKNRRCSSDSAQAEVRDPLLVRLARGDVSERVARELTCILRALCHDAALTPRLGEVVTRLLTTAGQVVLRFSQYAEYPARAVLMSRKYNPGTYYQEVMRFLHVDAKALDSGYCQPLRREALGAAGRSSGSQTEAILHLLSQPVQEELSTIAMAIESSTLDVERKHNLDRRSEAPRVSSVSKASRDAFVRQWRTESRAAALTA